MRGEDQQQNHIFSYLSPEARVRKDHPLRAIRAMVDEVLSQLSRRFDGMYATVGLQAYSSTAQFECRSIPETHPFKTMAILSLCLGLRVSELLALRWSDVDWLNGKLNVERGIVNQIVDDVKTDGSRRPMTLDHELLAILRTGKQNSQFQTEQDWMFASPLKLGRLPYSYTGFWRSCRGPPRIQELDR
jgi:integrase